MNEKIEEIKKLESPPKVIKGLYTQKEINEFIRKIKSKPDNYIAQPLEILSTVPTIAKDGIDPRHVDLRPFVLTGKNMYVTAGGLTRVALNKGSYVVNSSQGGGVKDTWVLAD